MRRSVVSAWGRGRGGQREGWCGTEWPSGLVGDRKVAVPAQAGGDPSVIGSGRDLMARSLTWRLLAGTAPDGSPPRPFSSTPTLVQTPTFGSSGYVLRACLLIFS